MLRFSLSTTAENMTVNKLIIQNKSPKQGVQFGTNQGVSKVSVYSNTTETFDLTSETTTKLAEITPQIVTVPGVDNTSLPLTSSQVVSSQNITTFFILYDLENTAKLSATTNLTLLRIETVDGSIHDLTLESNLSACSCKAQNTISVTGVKVLESVDISPAVVLPGQESVPMLHVKIKAIGEDIEHNNLKLEFRNQENLFGNGINKLTLYTPNTADSENFKFNASETKNFLSTQFNFSQAEAPFLDPGSHIFSNFSGLNPQNFNLIDGVTKNFLLYYDIDQTISVTANTRVSAQIIGIEGQGTTSFSGSLLKWPIGADLAFDSIGVPVAGISLENTTNKVPPDNIFGPDTVAPMLSFTLKAQHTDITLNSVTIHNDGPIPYVTREGSQTGITLIEIFEDAEKNDSFTETDPLVASFNLGGPHPISGLSNFASSAIIPFQSPLSSTSGISLPSEGSAIFLVRYTFGSSIGSGTSTAFLGTVVASASVIIDFQTEERTFVSVGISGVDDDNKVSSTPTSSITLSATNVTVLEVKDISRSSAIEGQLKVPMLALTVHADSVINNVDISIVQDSNSEFSDNNSGVSRVYLYQDFDANQNFSPTTDQTLVSGTSTFSSPSEATFSNISLNSGSNYFLVLYDIGQKASGSVIKAQLQNIATQAGATLIVGGQLPAPITPASITISDSKITSLEVDIPNLPNNPSQTSFQIDLSIKSDSLIEILDIHPKFYLSSISGQDITYEFEIVGETPSQVDPGSTSITLEALHKTALSSGIAHVDVYVLYSLLNSSENILVSRHNTSSGFTSAVIGTVPTILLSSNVTQYPWMFPGYIKNVSVQVGSDKKSFTNGNVLSLSHEMVIELQDNGAFIDDASISLSLNGIPLTQSQDGSIHTYNYDKSNGIITIQELGNVDGSIILNARELNGNALSQTTLSFVISDDVEILRPLFYPNPYIMGQQDLILGFNLTKSADVTIYLYNHLGNEVHRQTQFFSVGTSSYQTLNISSSEQFLAPGIYICKLVAKSTEGETSSVSVTKLAIY